MTRIVRLALTLLSVITLCCLSCGNSSDNWSDTVWQDISNTPAQQVAGTPEPYLPNGRYADVLADCLLTESEADLCTLNTLPLIGQEHQHPTVKNILERTAVSHAWMGERFAEALAQMPADIRKLMKAVTGIVISSDIRPAFYNSAIGAIYLDPYYLWTTNAEKKTIDKQEDYRSEYGNKLNFVSPVQYMKGNRYAWRTLSLNGREERTIAEVVPQLARLLFHELAHANDFIPAIWYATLDGDMTVYDATIMLEKHTTSTLIDTYFPLESEIWSELSHVLYKGEEPTERQQSFTATNVGYLFENDGANDSYAYSAIYEDTAMLFEEVMMKYHFNIDRVLAFASRPAFDNARCDDHVVGWGVLNRTGDDMVRHRAELVVKSILNLPDASAYLAQMPQPVKMAENIGFCESLSMLPASSDAPAIAAHKSMLDSFNPLYTQPSDLNALRYRYPDDALYH